METLNRYDIIKAGDLSSDDDKASRSPQGRWMEAQQVLDAMEELGRAHVEAEQAQLEANETLIESLRVEQDKSFGLRQTVDILREANAELDNENRQLDAKVDELILEVRLQTKRAEDMVCMNANTIAARNNMAIQRDQAVISCRLSNKLRDSERGELVQHRERVGHLTGRLMDAAVLLHRLVQRPSFETVQHAREFVELIRLDTEGYTMTGPCDIPLLYAKVDILKEDGTPMEPGAPMPAPEPGVITPVVDPRPVAPGFVGRHASDGTLVAVHPDIAKSLDEAPGLWQSCVDAVAAGAKRLGIDPAFPTPETERALMQALVDAPPAPNPYTQELSDARSVVVPDQPSGAVGLLDVAEPLTPDHDACRDPNCPGHMDIAF